MKKALACSLAMILFIALLSPFALALAQEQNCKITKQLQDEMQTLSDDEELMAYIILTDIDYDSAMELFELDSPDLYEVYRYAKEEDIASEWRELYYEQDCTDNDAAALEDPIDPEALQLAVEKKREIFAEEYYSRNKSFIDRFVEEDKQVFVSKYSPLLIASLTKDMVNLIEGEKAVVYMDLFVNYPICDELTIANIATKADYVRDTLNYDGTNVKIGQIEERVPDTGVASLSTASITRYNSTYTSDHATDVATIMVGNSSLYKGVAPGAELYCYGAPLAANFYQGCEWLISQGVNIINASMGLPVSAGYYDITITKWVDHIAVQHDVHFVAAAGNTGSDLSIIAPGTF